jgi:hypothetical protein
LLLGLLALSSLGADVSPCGRARRPLPPVAPPPPSAAADADPQALQRCCRQCAAASTRDPAGVDLSVLPCTRYSLGGGAPGGADVVLTTACAELLASKKMLIGACQKMAAP